MGAAHSGDGHPADRLAGCATAGSSSRTTRWTTTERDMAKTWPNGKKVAVSVTVMFETWAEGTAPTYSVQTTHLKSGTVDHASKAWSTYGGRVGVWRLLNMLDRLRNSRHVLHQRALRRGISRRGQADRQIRPRPRRPCLYAGPAARLHVARRAAGHDPQEHRPAGGVRRQEGHRLGAARWSPSRRRPRASSPRPA